MMNINLIALINKINSIVDGDEVLLSLHIDNSIIFQIENVKFYAFYSDLIKCLKMNLEFPNLKDNDPKYISDEEVTEVLAKHVCNNLFMGTGKKAFPEIKD